MLNVIAIWIWQYQINPKQRRSKPGLTTGGLVAAVRTVWVAVTLPHRRDAAAVPTLELVGLTLRSRP